MSGSVTGFSPASLLGNSAAAVGGGLLGYHSALVASGRLPGLPAPVKAAATMAGTIGSAFSVFDDVRAAALRCVST